MVKKNNGFARAAVNVFKQVNPNARLAVGTRTSLENLLKEAANKIIYEAGELSRVRKAKTVDYRDVMTAVDMYKIGSVVGAMKSRAAAELRSYKAGGVGRHDGWTRLKSYIRDELRSNTRLSPSAIPVLRGALFAYLSEIVRESLNFTAERNRIIITRSHVEAALKNLGIPGTTGASSGVVAEEFRIKKRSKKASKKASKKGSKKGSKKSSKKRATKKRSKKAATKKTSKKNPRRVAAGKKSAKRRSRSPDGRFLSAEDAKKASKKNSRKSASRSRSRSRSGSASRSARSRSASQRARSQPRNRKGQFLPS